MRKIVKIQYLKHVQILNRNANQRGLIIEVALEEKYLTFLFTLEAYFVQCQMIRDVVTRLYLELI